MKTTKQVQLCCISPKHPQHWMCATVLTSDARIDPPIQALNLRSSVVLLAINFKRILYEYKQFYCGCAVKRLISKMAQKVFFLKNGVS